MGAWHTSGSRELETEPWIILASLGRTGNAQAVPLLHRALQTRIETSAWQRPNRLPGFQDRMSTPI